MFYKYKSYLGTSVIVIAAAAAKLLQSCPTLCNLTITLLCFLMMGISGEAIRLNMWLGFPGGSDVKASA